MRDVNIQDLTPSLVRKVESNLLKLIITDLNLGKGEASLPGTYGDSLPFMK